MAGRRTVSERAAAKAKPPVRERLAADLEERYEKLVRVIDQALEATKKVSVQFNCKKCGQTQMQFGEVQDVSSAIKAAEFFANQGLGRPGEDQAGRGGGDFVLERYVVEPEGEE